MLTKQVFDYCRAHAEEIAAASPSGHNSYSHHVYAVWEDESGKIQAQQRDASQFGPGVPSFIGFKNCRNAADVLAHTAEVEEHENED